MTSRFVLRSCMASLALSVLLFSCSGSGVTVGRYAFELTLDGLPDSALMRGHYEGWAVGSDGVARSTGRFIIQGGTATALVTSPGGGIVYGIRSLSTFGPSITGLGTSFPFIVDARWFFITLEPEGDHDGVPSCQVLLSGAFLGDDLLLSTEAINVNAGVDCGVDVGGTTYLGLGDLASATGAFVMGSPTDDGLGPPPNDEAGVWFLNALPPTAAAGLDLPTLPGSLVYEGWAEVDGVWRSTGRFTQGASRDFDAATAPQRGSTGPGHEVPGQDFVSLFTPIYASDPPQLDLTQSLAFPAGDYRVLVTVEPVIDNDSQPFSAPILVKEVGPAASVGGVGGAAIVMDIGAAVSMGASASVAPGSLTLTGVTLPDLGASASDRRGAYEVFVTIGGVPFSVDRVILEGANVHSLTAGAVIGTTTTVTFTAANTMNPAFPPVDLADDVFVTLEPEADPDPAPSNRQVLFGAITGGLGTLAFPAIDLASVEGSFQLRTPSNNALNIPADDERGVSFVSNSLQPLLTLPVLSGGWTYEGWVEERLTGRFFSTGRFQDPSAPDSDSMVDPARGVNSIAGFPGREFLTAVPTVPRNAATAGSITAVMVTIEQSPDAETGPSSMVVFTGTVPALAVVGGVAQQVVPLTNEVATGASLAYSGFLTIDR